MKSDFTLSEDLQMAIEALKDRGVFLTGISERLNISPQLTETFKKVAGLQSFKFPDEFIEQIKKITPPLMKTVETGCIVPSGGGSLPTYESNYNNFEPQPIRIKIVIDND